jgi:LmbE family N-acetylglucosaminyl deacetylase
MYQNLLISPHNDDETLFAAFAMQKYKPFVVIVYDSHIQFNRGDPNSHVLDRRNETIAACRVLRGRCDAGFLGLSDAGEYIVDTSDLFLDAKDSGLMPGHAFQSTETVLDRSTHLSSPSWPKHWPNNFETVILPQFHEGGHEQHNLVATAFDNRWPEAKRIRYATYTRDGGKQTTGQRFPATGEQIALKLYALACYKSQLNRADCSPHFLRSQEEYYL